MKSKLVYKTRAGITSEHSKVWIASEFCSYHLITIWPTMGFYFDKRWVSSPRLRLFVSWISRRHKSLTKTFKQSVITVFIKFRNMTEEGQLPRSQFRWAETYWLISRQDVYQQWEFCRLECSAKCLLIQWQQYLSVPNRTKTDRHVSQIERNLKKWRIRLLAVTWCNSCRVLMPPLWQVLLQSSILFMNMNLPSLYGFQFPIFGLKCCCFHNFDELGFQSIRNFLKQNSLHFFPLIQIHF